MITSSLFIALGLLALSLVISAVNWSRQGSKAQFAGKQPGLWIGFGVLAFSMGIWMYYADTVLLPSFGPDAPGGSVGFWALFMSFTVAGWWFLPSYGTFLLSKTLGRSKP